jgi:hypothetical protein
VTAKNKSAIMVVARVIFGIAYFSMNKKFRYYLLNRRRELFRDFVIV